MNIEHELTLRRHLKEAYDEIKAGKGFSAYLKAGEYHAMLGETAKAFSCFAHVSEGAKGKIKWAGLIKKSTIMMHMNCFTLENVLEPLMEAYDIRPSYADPLLVASQAARSAKRYNQALLYSTMAIGIPMPKETKEPELYAWKSVYEYAMCAELAGYIENALDAYKEIAERDDIKLPEAVKAHVEQRITYLQKE